MNGTPLRTIMQKVILGNVLIVRALSRDRAINAEALFSITSPRTLNNSRKPPEQPANRKVRPTNTLDPRKNRDSVVRKPLPQSTRSLLQGLSIYDIRRRLGIAFSQ